MVDAVVSFVVERLGDYLIQEAVFLRGVRNEVESLKSELKWMQCFIKDAEEKQDDDPLIRMWVSDTRDIAYDTEDVLDKFLLEVNDGETSSKLVNSRKSSGFFASIKKHSCIFQKKFNAFNKGKEKVTLYSIGREIEALRKRIGDLSRKSELYGLQDINKKGQGRSKSIEKLKHLRRATSFADEENVVGFEDDAEILLHKLFEEEPRRSVISILGMGGLGKTTLARKLYHNNGVKSKFKHCCAWVSVSQDFETRDLLLRIIKSFEMRITNEELEQMSEEDMERYLRKILQERSYLVVIDDVWQKEAWESLKRAFPDNKNGSRIIITTRIKEVAERSDERPYVHKLRFLSPDESWQLFCEKAFQNLNAYKGLEKLGREMVEKCGGLPLAIVVLGGLLSTKKPQEWRMVRNHIWRHLRNDSIHISNLLALSFNDLPSQLKLCFLYIGLFPEDSEIKVEKLIRLFVAEGFTPQDDGRVMEDVAKDNLDQLISRSLVQVGKICWGRIATCWVHDLLRDLAIQKAKELNFIQIYDRIETCPSSTISPCRRQAVYSCNKYLWLQNLNPLSPLSRSLLLLNQRWDESIIDMSLKRLCTSFTLLRVVDIEAAKGAERLRVRLSTQRYQFPEEIGKLIHLKYLGLRNTLIHTLPQSILNLQRLQTLHLSSSTDISSSSWDHHELPIEICKLQELRHLIGCFVGNLRVDNLANLLTLKYVSLRSWTKINTDKLVNLQELRITSSNLWWNRERQEEFTFDSIAKLKNLQLLSVKLSGKEFSFGSLQPLSNCRCLVDLRLDGKINELPEEMYALLSDLECLSLQNSDLEDDPTPALEKLPNLVILHIFNHYIGSKLVFTDKGFPRLEILDLTLTKLQEWNVEEGAMPVLRGFNITTMFDIRIPERLRSIPSAGPLPCEDYW